MAGTATLVYSLLAGLGVAVAVAMVWYILDGLERALIDRVTESTGRGVEALIKNDIEDRVTLLSGLAHRWGQPAELTRAEWEAAVRNIFETQPGYEAIGWVDTSLHVRWPLLHEVNETPVPDLDLRSRPRALAAAQAALDRDNVAFTDPLDSIHGGKGFGIYIPVYRPTPDGRKFDGLVGSVLLIDALLESVLPADLLAEHEVIISINGQTLFRTEPERPTTNQQWAKHRRFKLYDLNWQLEIVPKTEFLLDAYSRFSKTMLALLVILSSLAALTVYSLLTSRGRARQARDTARRLDQLLKNLPGMAYRCQDREHWPMVFVSDGCRALCGYNREELETQRVLWGTLIHPEDQEAVKQDVQLSAAEKRPFQLVYRIRHRDGGDRWVWEQGQRVPSDTATEMLEGFIMDITERVTSRRELAKEKAVLQTIVNGVPDALITADMNRKVTFGNPGVHQIFGYEDGELDGQPTSVLYANPQDFERQGKERFNKDAGKHYEVTEINWRRKNGETFTGETVGTVIRDGMGESIGFLALIRDITDRKLAEAALRERENHYRTVVETAGSVVLCVSTDFRILEFNPEAERIFGYSRQEALGAHVLELLLDKELWADTAAVAGEILSGKTLRGFELTCRTRDGGQRIVLFNATRLLDANDQPIGHISVGQDITELKLAQDKLVQSERLTAMGQMISSIAHESRNALQRIQAGVDMLKLDIRDGTEAAGDLAQIAKARSDLQTLLDGMRDFAAPVVLDLQTCNLRDVWQRSWRNVVQLGGGRQAELVEVIEGFDLQCRIDSFRIEQIFRNLIENAFDACADPVRITIACTDGKLENVSAVSISVRDNGPGLTPEQQDRIFEAFYTTKPKGTGLGMAIAMKTVKAHHGTLVAGNSETGGAEFVITLPRNLA